MVRQFLASKYGKVLKRTLKKGVYYLPEQIKFPFIRSIIRFSPEISSDVVIKVADNLEEIEAAFHVLNEAYREQGFLKEHRDQTDINKYQLLPMSTIIVAKFRGQVVGTLTLVKQNPIGMPMERVFKRKTLSDKSEKAAEITCLAIDRQYRRDAGTDLLFPLMKFMYHYAIDYFDVKKIFVACFPREADFYKSLLLFAEIEENPYVDDYLGAPALGLYLDLVKAKDQYRTVYAKARPSKNLFAYFTQMQSPQLIFPNRNFLKTTDSVWNYQTIQTFLKKNNRFKIPKLTEHELQNFKNFYFSKAHPEPLFVTATAYLSERSHRRFEANNSIKLLETENDSTPLQLLEVSKDGFRISSQLRFSSQKVYLFSIQISQSTWCRLKATQMWAQPGQAAGFRIIEAEAGWSDFIAFLDQSPAAAPASKSSKAG